jgi:membrane protease subunit (stomatin/prohibitin family)
VLLWFVLIACVGATDNGHGAVAMNGAWVGVGLGLRFATQMANVVRTEEQPRVCKTQRASRQSGANSMGPT